MKKEHGAWFVAVVIVLAFCLIAPTIIAINKQKRADADKERCVAAVTAMTAEIERGGHVQGLDAIEQIWDESPYGSEFFVCTYWFESKEKPWTALVVIMFGNELAVYRVELDPEPSVYATNSEMLVQITVKNVEKITTAGFQSYWEHNRYGQNQMVTNYQARYVK